MDLLTLPYGKGAPIRCQSGQSDRSRRLPDGQLPCVSCRRRSSSFQKGAGHQKPGKAGREYLISVRYAQSGSLPEEPGSAETPGNGAFHSGRRGWPQKPSRPVCGRAARSRSRGSASRRRAPTCGRSAAAACPAATLYTACSICNQNGVYTFSDKPAVFLDDWP